MSEPDRLLSSDPGARMPQQPDSESAPDARATDAPSAAASAAGGAALPSPTGRPGDLARFDSATREQVVLQTLALHGNRHTQRRVARASAKRLALQRAPQPAAQPVPGPASGLLVDDATVDLQPQQMKRGAFLAQLRSAINTIVDQNLGSSIFAPILRTRAQQEIETQFAVYAGRTA